MISKHHSNTHDLDDEEDEDDDINYINNDRDLNGRMNKYGHSFNNKSYEEYFMKNNGRQLLLD